jgi:hypothetical protein
MIPFFMADCFTPGTISDFLFIKASGARAKLTFWFLIRDNRDGLRGRSIFVQPFNPRAYPPRRTNQSRRDRISGNIADL